MIGEEEIEELKEEMEELKEELKEAVEAEGEPEKERPPEIKAGVLKNVGVLNLKDMTEEDLKDLKAIKNTGVLIMPKELIGRLAQLDVKNVGVLVPYVKGMRVYAGRTTINADMLKALEEPISIIQAGKMDISGDVTPELIKEKIAELRNYGKITAPTRELYGALMAKVTENIGKIVVREEDE